MVVLLAYRHIINVITGIETASDMADLVTYNYPDNLKLTKDGTLVLQTDKGRAELQTHIQTN